MDQFGGRSDQHSNWTTRLTAFFVSEATEVNFSADETERDSRTFYFDCSVCVIFKHGD